jgi:hypothetical protein
MPDHTRWRWADIRAGIAAVIKMDPVDADRAAEQLGALTALVDQLRRALVWWREADREAERLDVRLADQDPADD